MSNKVSNTKDGSVNKLVTTYDGPGLRLKNHIVMAPMTRSRAIGNIPNAMMAQYYSQRAGAGLIITEGTAPAPEALGYPRIPGIFSQEHVTGWKLVTAAVHKNDTKIFLQMMHTGRIAHVANLPEGVTPVGASEIPAKGQMHTDTVGSQDYSTPAALTREGVQKVIASYVTSARNAIAAGFDGVELHGANGYLIEQFLNPNVNKRTDLYGGSIENRVRFATEAIEQVAEAIGKDKVGIRLSPNSTLGDLQPYDEDTTQGTYALLARELNRLGIVYVHVAVNPSVAPATLAAIRKEFKGTLIYCNGFSPETAEAELQKGTADLIAFGRNFLANPDLVERIVAGASLNPVDFTTIYSPGEKGYLDYPVMSAVSEGKIL